MRASQAIQWGGRLVLACLVAVMVASAALEGVDAMAVPYSPVQVDALAAIDSTLKTARKTQPMPLRIAFFGDSLAQTKNAFADFSRSTPPRIIAHLGSLLDEKRPGLGKSVQLVPVIYSGLSQWSYFYVHDQVIETRPAFAVIEFNLYNFSSFWRGRDRKILAALLELSFLPQVMALPTGSAGLATDEWFFGRALVEAELVDPWRRTQREQARFASAYWQATHAVQRSAAGRDLGMLKQHTLSKLGRDVVAGSNRASAAYSRMLLGATLSGVTEDDAALRMFDAVLDAFARAGIRTVVYIPPYNLDHLKKTGVLPDPDFEGAIEKVQSVAHRNGARLVDLHAKLPDRYFRDQMDHLEERPEVDGHDEIARSLAEAMLEDAMRVAAGER